LYVRGKGVFAGYHDRPMQTAEALPQEGMWAGWLNTGDIASLGDVKKIAG